MADKLWMYSVFFFLILLAPIFLIMMILILTDIPLAYSFFWLPFAISGSWLIMKWSGRKDQKLHD